MHFCAAAVAASAAALPVMWWVWVGAGTGNSNFPYFATLSLQVAALLLALEALAALVRGEWAVEQQVAAAPAGAS